MRLVRSIELDVIIRLRSHPGAEPILGRLRKHYDDGLLILRARGWSAGCQPSGETPLGPAHTLVLELDTNRQPHLEFIPWVGKAAQAEERENAQKRALSVIAEWHRLAHESRSRNELFAETMRKQQLAEARQQAKAIHATRDRRCDHPSEPLLSGPPLRCERDRGHDGNHQCVATANHGGSVRFVWNEHGRLQSSMTSMSRGDRERARRRAAGLAEDDFVARCGAQHPRHSHHHCVLDAGHHGQHISRYDASNGGTYSERWSDDARPDSEDRTMPPPSGGFNLESRPDPAPIGELRSEVAPESPDSAGSIALHQDAAAAIAARLAAITAPEPVLVRCANPACTRMFSPNGRRRTCSNKCRQSLYRRAGRRLRRR
jgi:hypothetical protein